MVSAGVYSYEKVNFAELRENWNMEQAIMLHRFSSMAPSTSNKTHSHRAKAKAKCFFDVYCLFFDLL